MFIANIHYIYNTTAPVMQLWKSFFFFTMMQLWLRREHGHLLTGRLEVQSQLLKPTYISKNSWKGHLTKVCFVLWQVYECVNEGLSAVKSDQ